MSDLFITRQVDGLRLMPSASKRPTFPVAHPSVDNLLRLRLILLLLTHRRRILPHPSNKHPGLKMPRRVDHLVDGVDHEFRLIELNEVTALLRDDSLSIRRLCG
jgi:hypothetical protein